MVPETVSVPFLDLERTNAPLKDAILADIADLIDSNAFTNGPQVTEFEEVNRALEARGFTRMVFDLSRIGSLLDLLGTPQRAYPSIHVTGTNGKTSTARMVDSLEGHGLAPSPEAERTTLLRRLYLDLVGLPPSPRDVEDFLADSSPDAYDKLVSRLLASPHYGERMALPWLDAARYADSNGFQQDGDNYQYVWRDWVVRALNANMPFDRFTI